MRLPFLLLLTILFNSSSSQIFSFKNYGEDDGLPQGFVYDINQDSKGYINIGTGEGLSIYGGYNFNTIKTLNGLSENFITTLFRDSKNYMWLGHFEGSVSRIDNKGRIDTIRPVDDVNSKISQIIELCPDQYIFLKSNAGLILYNDALKSYSLIKDDAYTDVVSIISNRTDLILLKTDGLYSVKIDKFKAKNYALTKIKTLGNPVMMRFNMHKDKIMIVDDALGVLTFYENYNAIDTFKINKKTTCSYTTLFCDRFNTIYLGTTENGFYKLDQETGSITNYSMKNGLKSNAIQSIFVDREDNLWIGTYGKGVQQLNNELCSYNLINDKDYRKTSINAVTKYCNKILVATNYGLGFLEGNRVNYINKPLTNNTSINHLIYLDNSFYFSSEEGKLYKSDTTFSNIKEIRITQQNQELNINSLCSNSKSLFVCSSAGLAIFNTKDLSYKFLNTDDGILHNNIKYVFEDSKNRLWVCSSGSPIFYLDTNYKITVFKDIKGLRNFNINSVCEDNDKTIWISTLGDGVFKYNENKFEKFDFLSGLKSNYCYGIKADANNGIWVNHINGISFKNNNKKNFNRIASNSAELMQLDFIENSSYYDKSKHDIILGTSEGIVTLRTSKQRYNEAEPILNLSSVIINGKEFINLTDTVLNYNTYDVSFNFIGICLTDPTKVTYKYFLEGHEDDWRELTFETRILNFSKLKDGEYTLKMLASNNDGLWTSNPMVFKFTVLKPYWKKAWFYIILFICLILIIWLIIKKQTANLNESKKRLEQIVAIKTSEITQEKTKIEGLFEEITSKNKDITDSINYAKRIQEALLPLDTYMKQSFDLAYIYKAKDIVSGDFYWFKKTQNYSFIAVVDCTGHGVPGAFMSFIGSTLLDDIVDTDENLNPSEILQKLDVGVIKMLNQHSEAGQKNMDGMDIAVLKLNPKDNTIQISGAVRPIYLYTHKELIKIKSTVYSIGGAFSDIDKQFSLYTHNIQNGDNVFLFTDGYADQSGGEKNKRYTSARLQKFLEKIADYSIEKQEYMIAEEFDSWKGDNEQIDDVLLMSVKFK